MLPKNHLNEQFKKTAEATSDLIGKKIADKITSINKPKENKTTKGTEELYIPPE